MSNVRFRLLVQGPSGGYMVCWPSKPGYLTLHHCGVFESRSSSPYNLLPVDRHTSSLAQPEISTERSTINAILYV